MRANEQFSELRENCNGGMNEVTRGGSELTVDLLCFHRLMSITESIHV